MLKQRGEEKHKNKVSKKRKTDWNTEPFLNKSALKQKRRQQTKVLPYVSLYSYTMYNVS